MFLTFQKITSGDLDKKSSVLVNSNALILLTTEDFRDQSYGAPYTTTRVELPGFTFNTTSPLADVLDLLHTVDARTGAALSGTTCAGTPGALDFVYLNESFPLLRMLMIVNNNNVVTREYAFNPQQLQQAEEFTFHDVSSQSTVTGLMLTLRESGLRRIPTKLAFADLELILGSTVVPTP